MRNLGEFDYQLIIENRDVIQGETQIERFGCQRGQRDFGRILKTHFSCCVSTKQIRGLLCKFKHRWKRGSSFLLTLTSAETVSSVTSHVTCPHNEHDLNYVDSKENTCFHIYSYFCRISLNFKNFTPG